MIEFVVFYRYRYKICDQYFRFLSFGKTQHVKSIFGLWPRSLQRVRCHFFVGLCDLSTQYVHVRYGCFLHLDLQVTPEGDVQTGYCSQCHGVDFFFEKVTVNQQFWKISFLLLIPNTRYLFHLHVTLKKEISAFDGIFPERINSFGIFCIL